MSEIRPNDVILGRGGFSYKHPGNEAFRELAKSLAPRYISSSKPEKSQISKEMVYRVYNMNPPGRFLKRVREDEYEEAGFIVAREKASQCLRDASALLIQENFDVDAYKEQQRRISHESNRTNRMPPEFQGDSYNQVHSSHPHEPYVPYERDQFSSNYRNQQYRSANTGYNVSQMDYGVPMSYNRDSMTQMQRDIPFAIPDFPPRRRNTNQSHPLNSPVPHQQSYDLHEQQQRRHFFPSQRTQPHLAQIPQQVEIYQSRPHTNPSFYQVAESHRSHRSTYAFHSPSKSNSPTSQSHRDYLGSTPPQYIVNNVDQYDVPRQVVTDEKMGSFSPDYSKLSVGINVDEIDIAVMQAKSSSPSRSSPRSMKLTRSKSYDELTLDLEKVSTSKSWSPQSAKMTRSRSFDDFDFLPPWQSTSESIGSIDSFKKSL